MFRSYETCSDVWAQAKLLYTTDTQPMAEYLGKIHALLHEFNELLPPASTPAEEHEQRSKFFMWLALHGLSDEYSHVRNQILGSPVVPNFTASSSALLRMPRKQIIDTSTCTDDSSVFGSTCS